MSERETKEQKLRRIAEQYVADMKRAGMDLTSVEDQGTPTISFYVHGHDCASRRGSECDCREKESP